MAPALPLVLGHFGPVRFSLARIDIAAPVDLLIVGMQAGRSPTQAAGGESSLDAALHGTLGRLRAGGIFTAAVGEELTLSTPPPPIRAKALMLIGMGTPPAAQAELMGALAHQAMRGALRCEARRVACLLGWNGLALPHARIAAGARAMMRGVLAALERHGPGAQPMEWMFDIHQGDAVRIAAALQAALAEWAPPG